MTTLVDAGAWVDGRSWGEVPPLLFAVREGHADSVQALLAAQVTSLGRPDAD